MTGSIPQGLSVDLIARRIMRELVPGTLVNLGVGLSVTVASVASPDDGVMFHAENGLMGFLGWRDAEDPDQQIFRVQVGLIPGAASMDHVTSFGLIRTGRVHTTVLGAYEVDEDGHLANWLNPASGIGSVGGAIELLHHCKQVIVAMRHLDKNGRSKVRRRCDGPLTGERPVDIIVTDFALLRPTGHGSLRLCEVAPGVSVEEVVRHTEARLEYQLPVPAMEF